MISRASFLIAGLGGDRFGDLASTSKKKRRLNMLRYG
jgi:hypothetical protein